MIVDTEILDQFRGTETFDAMVDRLIRFSEERRLEGQYTSETIAGGMSRLLDALLRGGHDESSLDGIRTYLALLRPN